MQENAKWPLVMFISGGHHLRANTTEGIDELLVSAIEMMQAGDVRGTRHGQCGYQADGRAPQVSCHQPLPGFAEPPRPDGHGRSADAEPAAEALKFGHVLKPVLPDGVRD